MNERMDGRTDERNKERKNYASSGQYHLSSSENKYITICVLDMRIRCFFALIMPIQQSMKTQYYSDPYSVQAERKKKKCMHDTR